MQERVKQFHDNLNQHIDAASEYVSGEDHLNQHIDAASEYMSGEDDVDFITDDVALPVGYLRVRVNILDYKICLISTR